ncbi:MAG: radical SAM/SPASM domain-containing protein [Planctomycetota bacterium]
MSSDVLTRTRVVLSMLHQRPGESSAEMVAREKPVLAWTVDRLVEAGFTDLIVICWDDQLSAVRKLGLAVHNVGVRRPMPRLDALTVATRWHDGWRGGLLNSSCFDAGWHGAAVAEAFGDDQPIGLLVDPAAAVLDPALLRRVAEKAEQNQWSFTPALPGLSGFAFDRDFLRERLAGDEHPGRYLTYTPDRPMVDPLFKTAGVQVDAALHQAFDRLLIDSPRQVRRFEELTHVPADAHDAVDAFAEVDADALMPRDVTLEINTQRPTRPVWWAGNTFEIDRPDMNTREADRIFRQLGEVGDVRVTLGGVGDPLLSPYLPAILSAARMHGIALNVETDLLPPDEIVLDLLAEVDVVTVNLPAMRHETYAAIMGVPRMAEALQNLGRLVLARSEAKRGTPLVVPKLVKLRENMDEMEAWYDQWLGTLGSAVIDGPSSAAGQLVNLSVTEMKPPKRVPCRRLGGRMTILSDGQVVRCEEDIRALHPIGSTHNQTIADLWSAQQHVHELHLDGEWETLNLCNTCSEWHRW